MKIAYIGQKGVPAIWGGIERHVEHLSQRVADLGVTALVYTRPHYVSKAYVHQHNKKKTRVQLLSLPSINTKHFDAITHTLVCTLHAVKENVDVYHYHGVGPSLLSWIPRLLRPRARVVTTFHSPDRLHQKWGLVARLMLTLGELTSLLFAHETITVSKNLQQYCKKQYKRDTTYIPNGVPQVENKKASRITAQFGLQQDEYILVVTRLVRHKGVHHLIRAFNMIDTDKKLVVVGDSAHTDDYVQELEELAQDNDNILFTGYQSGAVLEELFSNCYLYVQPSESEGLSISLLEAGSYGRAVLVSDIPANMEIAERRGFTFKNTDVSDLAYQLQHVLDSPIVATEAGKKLRQYILQEYHWDTIAKHTVDLYESALGSATVQPRVRVTVK